MADPVAPLGIEKLEAVMDSLTALNLKIIKMVKGGLSVTGAASLALDPAVDAAIVELYNDLREAIAEAKDIDASEGIQLAMKTAAIVPQYVSAIKGT